MDRQIEDHLVEPNSGLGQAITYPIFVSLAQPAAYFQ